MAAAAGDADQALTIAQSMPAAPSSPQRTRLYHPALVAYTVMGNHEAAFKVLPGCPSIYNLCLAFELLFA